MLKDTRTDIIHDLKDLAPVFGDRDPLVILYQKLLYIDDPYLMIDCTTGYYTQEDIEGLIALVESTQ